MEDDAKHRKDKDNEVFDRLKCAVLEAALNEHQWDSKALDYLVLSVFICRHLLTYHDFKLIIFSVMKVLGPIFERWENSTRIV